MLPTFFAQLIKIELFLFYSSIVIYVLIKNYQEIVCSLFLTLSMMTLLVVILNRGEGFLVGSLAKFRLEGGL